MMAYIIPKSRAAFGGVREKAEHLYKTNRTVWFLVRAFVVAVIVGVVLGMYEDFVSFSSA
jgi:hypothetical protein